MLFGGQPPNGGARPRGGSLNLNMCPYETFKEVIPTKDNCPRTTYRNAALEMVTAVLTGFLAVGCLLSQNNFSKQNLAHRSSNSLVYPAFRQTSGEEWGPRADRPEAC